MYHKLKSIKYYPDNFAISFWMIDLSWMIDPENSRYDSDVEVITMLIEVNIAFEANSDHSNRNLTPVCI